MPKPKKPDFVYSMQVNDGGIPFDIIDRESEDCDCACVSRGLTFEYTGSNLLDPWDNYLHAIGPTAAPVNETDLDSMWAKYDAWKELPEACDCGKIEHGRHHADCPANG